jgi:hypothetical protein
MTRLLGALVASIVCLSPVAASLGTPKDLSREHREPYRRAKQAVAAAHATEQGVDFVMTADSEVWLDGRPCEYKKVPATAEIVRVEVAPDRKTILRIEFRSAK